MKNKFAKRFAKFISLKNLYVHAYMVYRKHQIVIVLILFVMKIHM